jgi:hypothetical protein
MGAHLKGIVDLQPPGTACWRVPGVLVVLCLAAASVAAAQPAEEAPVEVELGSDIVPPGGSAAISIGVRVGPGSSVARIVVEVGIPRAQAAFQEVRTGLMAEMSGAKVSGKEKPGSDPKTTTAVIEVTHEKQVPDGVVATLAVKTEGGLAEGTEILLPATVTAFTSSGDKKQIKVADGKVLISSIPVPACFFYMH